MLYLNPFVVSTKRINSISILTKLELYSNSCSLNFRYFSGKSSQFFFCFSNFSNFSFNESMFFSYSSFLSLLYYCSLKPANLDYKSNSFTLSSLFSWSASSLFTPSFNCLFNYSSSLSKISKITRLLDSKVSMWPSLYKLRKIFFNFKKSVFNLKF